MPAQGHDLIAIGASAGGVEALQQLVKGLPQDLPAAVCVVLHVSPVHRSMLARILDGSGPLHAVKATDGEALRLGRIYVAPPDRHLVVEEKRLRLVYGPSENGHRPAVDPLFRSVARAYEPRAIGVVLSGVLDCGSAGLGAIQARGGLAVVQDPDDAICGDMPRNAMLHVRTDHCLPAAQLGPVLGRLSRQPAKAPGKPPPFPPAARPSHFSCPACGGVLSEVIESGSLRFRCRIGHSFGPEGLSFEQGIALEGALWAALRALEERAALSHGMAERARELGQVSSAARFEERGLGASQQASMVRDALNGMAEPKVAPEPKVAQRRKSTTETRSPLRKH